jgi:hypothetical protein
VKRSLAGVTVRNFRWFRRGAHRRDEAARVLGGRWDFVFA